MKKNVLNISMIIFLSAACSDEEFMDVVLQVVQIVQGSISNF
jgi:hypothetical protein